MPFEIWVSRFRCYEEILDAHVSEGAGPGGQDTPSRLRDAPRLGPEPIHVSQYHALMAEGTTRRPDGLTYWVRYPDSDEAWFATEWRRMAGDRGSVVIALSYSNPMFIRNWVDAFDRALAMARTLEANVFEEHGGQQITPDNMPRVLDPFGGALFKAQVATYREAMRIIRTTPRAPLEYPLGPIDAAPEYFLFRLRPAPGLASRRLEEFLPHEQIGMEADPQEPRSVVLRDASSGEALVHVWRTEEEVAARPAWGEPGFRRLAQATLTLVGAWQDRGMGEVSFGTEPLTPGLMADLREHSQGLGVEFLEWAQSRGELAGGSRSGS